MGWKFYSDKPCDFGGYISNLIELDFTKLYLDNGAREVFSALEVTIANSSQLVSKVPSGDRQKTAAMALNKSDGCPFLLQLLAIGSLSKDNDQRKACLEASNLTI
jgi:hypothetical protein